MTTDLQPKKSWTERKIGRRSFLVKGAAATGIAVAAMYVAPSLVSSGPKPAYAQATGGCTPGFWKNHNDVAASPGLIKFTWPSPYTPSTLFTSVFSIDVSSTASGWPDLNKTLLAVLEQGGGCEKALGRHAVAALLNAASLGFPTFPIPLGSSGSPGTVIGDTETVLNASNEDAVGCTSAIQGLKDDFVAANEGTCHDGGANADL